MGVSPADQRRAGAIKIDVGWKEWKVGSLWGYEGPHERGREVLCTIDGVEGEGEGTVCYIVKWGSPHNSIIFTMKVY